MNGGDSENSQSISTVDELRKHISTRMHLKYECVDLVLESGERIMDGVELSDVGLQIGLGKDTITGIFCFAQSSWSNSVFHICCALFMYTLLLPVGYVLKKVQLKPWQSVALLFRKHLAGFAGKNKITRVKIENPAALQTEARLYQI